MKTKKVAVIGAGHLGKIHAKLLKTIEGVDPFVVETHPAAQEFVEQELGIPVFDSVNDLGESLDGAIIVTPTQTHYEVASELMDKGCHLFIEKPICADVNTSRLICEKAERNGLTLQVGHVERFNPAFVAATPVLKNIQSMEFTRHTPYAFRATDVSVVQDLMIHDIDLALSTIRSEVVDVRAAGTRLIGPHWDSAIAWLDFANGAKVCLRASRVSSQPDRSLQCHLRDGWIDVNFATQSVSHLQPVDDIRNRLEALSAAEQQAAREVMFEQWLPVSNIEVTPQNAILEEQKEFVACLNDECYPTVSGRDGLAAVEVAERVLAKIEESSGQPEKRPAASYETVSDRRAA